MEIICGDCRNVLEFMPSASVHCIVTSPPYFGLRDYDVEGQMGLEPTPDEFVSALVGVLREARRVLRGDGTLWLNLGDSYAATTKGSSGKGKNATNKGTLIADRSWQVPPGLKPKDLIGIPWRVAFALQADGWYLRQDIIWSKPNPMPESVTDRCTKAHEYIFMLSKSKRYYYDADAIKEPRVGDEDARTFRGGAYVNNATFNNSTGGKRSVVGNKRIGKNEASGLRRQAGVNQRWNAAEASGAAQRLRNKRSVWTVAPKPVKEAHFATFPPDLIEPCILAGCPVGGTVLDPFFGAGTTGLVAERNGRNAIGIELNPDYVEIAKRRLGLAAPEPRADDTVPEGIFA